MVFFYHSFVTAKVAFITAMISKLNLFNSRGSNRCLQSEAHDLEEFNSGSELGFFEFKNFVIWMQRSSSTFPRVQHRFFFCRYLGIKLVS